MPPKKKAVAKKTAPKKTTVKKPVVKKAPIKNESPCCPCCSGCEPSHYFFTPVITAILIVLSIVFLVFCYNEYQKNYYFDDTDVPVVNPSGDLFPSGPPAVTPPTTPPPISE